MIIHKLFWASIKNTYPLKSIPHINRASFSKQKKQYDSQEQEQKNTGRNVEPDQQNPETQSKEKQKNYLWAAWRVIFWSCTAIYSYQLYNVFNYTKSTPIENQPSSIPVFIDAAKATQKLFYQTIQFFTRPPVKKFLPDVLHPDIPQKTLVLNLSGTIIHTDFVFGKGNKYILRPGLTSLLQKFSQIYEIIIFTEDDNIFIMNTLPSVDPKSSAIRAIFGKQSMCWSKSGYYKDLNYLNRDLRNVVVIDKSKEKVKNHKRNVIVLPQFTGSEQDRQLLDLIPLLNQLAKPEVRDIRSKLQSYGAQPFKNFKELMDKKMKKIQQKKSSYNRFLGFVGNKKQI